MAEVVATITPTRLAADATQRAELTKFFASAGFQIFKEMVAGRCAEAQAKACHALCYPDQPVAIADKEDYTKIAVISNACLDLLDDYINKEDLWYTVKLEICR